MNPTSLTKYYKAAIIEARKCVTPAGEKVHPKVGAVAIKNGKLLAQAHREELHPGEHAEYTLLEHKLPKATLAGATIFTTLEPCTARNNHKIPCVDRLISRKVKRVYIGMLDPNPIITGRGQLALRSAGIETVLFPTKYMEELEELNASFISAHKNAAHRITMAPDFLAKNRNRSLDTWYETVNRIYWSRNFQASAFSLFTHFVEAVGGLSLLVTGKTKKNVTPEKYVPKAIAWWMAVCGKLGVKSLEDMLWDKFPAACAYCHEEIHDSSKCSDMKEQKPGPDWATLDQLGKHNIRPQSLGQWQKMFWKIYPPQQAEDFGGTFARFCEELGELAEAIRVFSIQPGYLLSEACDVFAWLMHVQNLIELKNKTRPDNIGKSLENEFCLNYPDYCVNCGHASCSCPPILGSTIGRIAHEVPAGKGSFGELGRFMTPDRQSQRFKPLEE